MDPVCRIDYETGTANGLDDVAIAPVSMFRLEYMDDNSVWIRCYRDGEDDVVIRLHSAAPIIGMHEFD